MHSTVRAGTATVDITPPVGGTMAGFGVRTEVSVGVHDRLLCTALAVSRGRSGSIIVACDLISLDLADAAHLAERIGRETGVGRQSVSINVSHTHGGPKVKAVGFGVPRDEKYVRRLFDLIVDVAVRAWRRRRPARLRAGTSHLNSVAHNRRGTDVIDPAVFALQWIDLHGLPILTIFSHACHPVTLGPDNLLITADWPGAAREQIRRITGGHVMFLQGCAGQINTGHLASDSFRRESGPNRSFAEAERIGERVAAAVTSALRTARPVDVGSLRVQSEQVWLPMRPAPAPSELRRLEARWLAESESGEGHESRLRRVWSQWAGHRLGEPSAGGLSVPIAVHWWGEFGIVALPGEPFVEFALDLRCRLRLSDLLVLGYTGGVPGYIPLRPQDYDAGGYEIEIAYRSSKLFSGPYAREAGTVLFESALELAERQPVEMR